MVSASQVIRYDAMVHAIAECHRVDEVEEIRVKALALEMYARQAQNVEAERKATEIRLRAERKAGALLLELKREPGKRTDKLPATVAASSEYRAARESAGIPERTAERYQQLANVPKETFERHLGDTDVRPTTNGILRAANGAHKMDDGSLWVWGRLRDFEREGHMQHDPATIFGGMTETMQADVRRVLPRLLDWLNQMSEVAR